jgi:tRNA pseudouridine55 synthase
MLTEKEYTGTFSLGGTTPSFDRETEVDQTFSIAHISEEMIYDAARNFLGPQLQMPPMYSALKVEGKKLYDLARKGKEVERQPRAIEIKEFEITAINMPDVDFRVVVSKGTYIRSLAYDFGKALDSGAHLSALRRTKIGAFSVSDAMVPADWVDAWLKRIENLNS